MTSTKTISASVVTPHKVHRDRKVQARLLNRALGVHNSKAHFFRTAESATTSTATEPMAQSQKLKVVNNRCGSSSSSPPPAAGNPASKARVFRCLSNTASTAVTPEDRSRRSALKYTFTTQGTRHQTSSPSSPSSPQEQQTKKLYAYTLVYYGSQLDKSTLSHRPLRCSRPTKGCQSEEPSVAAAADKQTGEKKGSQTKRVSFHTTVACIKIPSHREYSDRTKRSMWGSMKEIKANAVRNTAEFIHDKCQWRNCVEEDQMYLDSRSGNLVHPVHVQRYYAAWQAQEQEKKRQQQQAEAADHERMEEEEETADKQPQQPEHHEQENDHASMNRKRVRCCSPSPVRRQSLNKNSNLAVHHRSYQHENTTPIKTTTSTSDELSGELDRQPKRLRIQAPVPCRQPPMAAYYSTPPQAYPHPSQENYACFYDQQQQQAYYHHHHHSMMAMRNHFPHPMRCPPTEIV
jgi:hypothetical protein